MTQLGRRHVCMLYLFQDRGHVNFESSFSKDHPVHFIHVMTTFSVGWPLLLQLTAQPVAHSLVSCLSLCTFGNTVRTDKMSVMPISLTWFKRPNTWDTTVLTAHIHCIRVGETLFTPLFSHSSACSNFNMVYTTRDAVVVQKTKFDPHNKHSSRMETTHPTMYKVVVSRTDM